MDISVLIEPIAGGYRATSTTPIPATAEAASRDEVLSKLRAVIDARLRAGAEIARLDVGQLENPWMAMAGMWQPGDPYVVEWMQIMADNRKVSEPMAEAS